MTTPESTPQTPDERDPYDRAARRLADNRHGNNRHTGEWDRTDDIRRAIYPDPKAAHLYGETDKVTEARLLAAEDRPEPKHAAKPASKPAQAKK